MIMSKTTICRFRAVVLALCAVLLLAGNTYADVNRVRIGHSPGFSFLPIYLMEHDKLMEKHAKAAGLGDITVEYPEFTGGAAMNDALLSGNMEFVNGGVPPYLILWARAVGTSSEVRALGAVSAGPAILFSRNPQVHSIRDLTQKDRISVAAVRASQVAILLEMAAEQEFGAAQYARLDDLTVSMPQPDSVIMMTARQTMEIDTHFTVPPYTLIEQRDPMIHAILNSKDVLGGIGTVIVAYTTTRFHDANPHLVAAYQAALQEAAQFIHDHPRRTAEIYRQMTHDPLSVDDLDALVRDPDISYQATPTKMMVFADFMARLGSLHKRPADWRDLFFAEARSLPGN